MKLVGLFIASVPLALAAMRAICSAVGLSMVLVAPGSSQRQIHAGMNDSA